MRSFVGTVGVLVSTQVHAAALDELRSSVFKISMVSNEPSFSEPWKRQQSSSASGTGFYIGDGRILTNAHVIANASFLMVQRDGDPKPTPAVVAFVAHDADLALLVPEDPKIFAGTRPMTFGPVPRLRSPVATIGYPTGGEQLSITEGIVSRISYRRYVHDGDAEHLLVQVDSAINPGNSGGPVVQGRQVVGVAFQSYTQAENTGYIIPVPVIRRFLKDVEDGHYDGHPKDGLMTFEWAMVNPGTAAYHGLKAGEGGVKVAHVAPWCEADGKLKAGDILLELDGRPIGVDGKVDFQGERVDFRTLYDLRQIGERARYQVARDADRLSVEVPVGRGKAHYQSQYVYAKRPRYMVYGGLVFTALSRSFLRTWGERWYKDAPLLLRFLDAFADFEPWTADLEDVVVLAKRLPDEVNAYATSDLFGVVTKVDGKEIHSVADLAKAFEADGPELSEFLVVDFFGSDDPLVLSRAKVRTRNAAINQRYGVVPDRWLAGPEDDGAVNRAAGGAP